MEWLMCKPGKFIARCRCNARWVPELLPRLLRIYLGNQHSVYLSWGLAICIELQMQDGTAVSGEYPCGLRPLYIMGPVSE
jgi:hypothetical protein